jgi:hypothetical protein
LVKQRLQDFLEISASVEFDEELNTGDRKFANPEYERKNDQWKMCYRAGKEVVHAAREFAEKWLAELTEKI